MLNRKFFGFSLVELMISIMVIGVIAGSLTPVITKKLESDRTTLSAAGGMVTIDCKKISPKCTTCNNKGCMTCDMEPCTTGTWENIQKCECTPCSTIKNEGEPITSSCIKCEKGNCIQCTPNYYIHNGKCKKCPAGKTCNGVIMQDCPKGQFCQEGQPPKDCYKLYYNDKLNAQDGSYCKPCNTLSGTCTDCNKENGICTQCTHNDGSYLLKVNSQTHKTECKQCSQFIPRCKKCTSETSCKECFDEYIFVMDNKNGNKCKSCEEVHAHCAKCTKEGLCLYCKNGYILDNNVCKLASELKPDCAQWDDSTKRCLRCNRGYMLNRNACVICSNILNDPHCNECDNQNGCTNCSDGYSLSGKSCVSNEILYPGCKTWNVHNWCLTCLTNYFLDSDGHCIACNVRNPNCSSCYGNGKCQNCITGYALNQNTCTACNMLHAHCKTCTASACLECQKGYKLNNGKCEEEKPKLKFSYTGQYSETVTSTAQIIYLKTSGRFVALSTANTHIWLIGGGGGGGASVWHNGGGIQYGYGGEGGNTNDFARTFYPNNAYNVDIGEGGAGGTLDNVNGKFGESTLFGGNNFRAPGGAGGRGGSKTTAYQGEGFFRKILTIDGRDFEISVDGYQDCNDTYLCEPNSAGGGRGGQRTLGRDEYPGDITESDRLGGQGCSGLVIIEVPFSQQTRQ